jgi:RimJ/RimL family protein N-acetyltransferase
MDDFQVRPAREEDVREMAELMATVAEERDRIASEPPVDVEARAKRFAASLPETFVADVDGCVIGHLHIDVSPFGFGELGMLVDAGWRGRGVGSALVHAAIEWAKAEGLHKLSLEVFPHNKAAIALYRKFGFVEEGRRVKQIRRDSGELWDTLVMGLLLE